MYAVQCFGIDICLVHKINCIGFGCNLIHDIALVIFSIRNKNEFRNAFF